MKEGGATVVIATVGLHFYPLFLVVACDYIEVPQSTNNAGISLRSDYMVDCCTFTVISLTNVYNFT
jgi:hypothetical protein